MSVDWAPIQQKIDEAWAEPARLSLKPYQEAVEAVIAALDAGQLRCATPTVEGEWLVHEWVKRAILLYFRMRGIESVQAGELTFADKIPVKRKFAKGVRVVPPGVARYGSYLAPGTILMPGYVNIGAYVGEGSMIDTWATVGSCAQIGKNVHISGGVGIGGVLEPPQAHPVIIEDGAFIGSRCIVVEGVRVGAQAVLGAGVILTASIPIIDATRPSGPEFRGYVPPRAIVVAGTREKDLPGGRFGLPCGLIIGWRSEKHDDKLALNAFLRDLGVPM